MSKKSIVRSSLPEAAIENPDRKESRAAVPVMDVIPQIVRIAFSGSGAAWSTGSQDIALPAGWRRAIASVRGFDLGYTNDDHSVFQVGVNILLTVVGTNLRVKIEAIIRDSNADDARDGTVDVSVLFIV